MLQLQDQINSQVNPDWKTANQDWLTAIFVESGEAVESHGYKWWKKQTPDMDNVRLELVDIWHFVMSHFIVVYGDTMLDLLAERLHKAFSEPFDSLDTPFNEVVRWLNAELTMNMYYDAWASFAYLCDKAELSWAELYSTYIAKNALNAFRAANGYKEGTYKKIWDDQNHEDNYFLMEYLKEVDVSTTEDLYEQVYNYLTVTYKTV